MEPLTGEEFKRAVATIGLSVYAAAPFLGMSLRHTQRIAAGEYYAPEAVTKLLSVMIKYRISAADFDRLVIERRVAMMGHAPS